ncbi:MAG: hypothetical protein EOP90_11470 [Lysobacteraceae bacterium]|nr:MAG: hypothetical protein EOP90_11470 [Xanthomonadaceae bacterium]
MTARPTVIHAALACLALTLPTAGARADDGDPDPTFDVDGRAWHVWPADFVQAETTAVATLRDGSVVAAGWVDRGDDNRDFALVKFRSDGSLDTTFGVQGTRVVAFDLVAGGDDRAFGVFERSDGKLLVAGSAGIDAAPYALPASLRLHADGQLDATYGTGGKAWVTDTPWNSPSFVFAHAAQDAAGRIVLAGLCTNCGQGGLPDFVAMRLTTTGAADATFGNDGYASFGREGPDGSWMVERASGVAIDRQGRVLLAGHEETYTDPDERQRPLLLRLTPAGVPDATFGNGGHVVLDMLGSWDASALAADPGNDSVMLALNTTHMPAVVPATFLVRVRSTGVLDTVFGEGGLVGLQWAEGNAVHALAIDAERRINAAGWVDPDGAAEAYFFAARVLHDGTLDASFDGNGVCQLAMPIDTNTHARASAIGLSGGRPVLAGSLYDVVGSRFATGIARLQSDRIFADGLEP